MLQRLAALAACAAVAAQLLRASWDATVCVEPGDEIPKLEAPRGDGCWVAVNATIGAKWATGYLGACAAQDFDDTIRIGVDAAPLTINAATPWTLHCAAVASCRWHARRRGDELAVCSGDLCGNQIYGAFVLNRRVDLHAIDATPARWRGYLGSSPLDGASAATSSPRNDLVENYRVHSTHWLISTQVVIRSRG